MKRIKILKCYPFADKRVKLVEGFKEYVGYLGDEKGALHKGIDYVVEPKKEKFVSFDVFSAHDGFAWQGINKNGWGKYVVVYSPIMGNYQFSTIYAHFRCIDVDIPVITKMEVEGFAKGLKVKAGRFLGRAGLTGWTKFKTQLHFELWKRNLKIHKTEKIDPYGTNSITKDYSQPGQSLLGVKHYWITDKPPFADEIFKGEER